MTINNRIFSVPALIVMDEDMGINIRFQFDKAPGHRVLSDHVRELGADIAFLWIDDCRKIRMEKSVYGLCVMMGKRGSEESEVKKLMGKNI